MRSSRLRGDEDEGLGRLGFEGALLPVRAWASYGLVFFFFLVATISCVGLFTGRRLMHPEPSAPARRCCFSDVAAHRLTARVG